MLQMFDIEVVWNKEGPVRMDIVNAKLIFNVKATKVVTNNTSRGIDGFCLFDENWYTFKRSQPF